MRHFIELARAGLSRPEVCSSSERRAAILAQALLEHGGHFDEAALEGFLLFAREAARNPNRARDLLYADQPK